MADDERGDFRRGGYATSSAGKSAILVPYAAATRRKIKAFLQELKEASSRGIVVVNPRKMPASHWAYATVNKLAHRRGLSVKADIIAPAATLTKLHYLLPCTRITGMT
ncbi:hypothetical protein KCP71_21055 [Salmonella enterica subsp. enterica]|nr:hypothetical protein KCP71_21055 [Salmonella enterica subsp. enterica]